MKGTYNKIINWIIDIILIIPMLALLAIKYLLVAVSKILKAIKSIVKVAISFVVDLRNELVKVLSVKD